MHNRIRFFLSVSCLSFMTMNATATEEAKVPSILTVAVMDFDSPDERGAAASSLLTALLSTNELLHLVERVDLARVLAESEIAMTSGANGDEAMKVGHLTGAKAIITGRIFKVGDREYMVGKCIGTETGRVFGHAFDYETGGDFTASVDALSRALAETLTTRSGELLAKVETPEERLERLRKAVGGEENLPTVYVAIPEQHLTRQVPDPAAQVEIQVTLQNLGFTLVDRAEDAVYVVSGEAFSERAGQHGNLVACRARLEIKITSSRTREIKVDRQTSVAIDLSEHIAAKSALQEGGRLISERILPFLVPKKN